MFFSPTWQLLPDGKRHVEGTEDALACLQGPRALGISPDQGMPFILSAEERTEIPATGSPGFQSSSASKQTLKVPMPSMSHEAQLGNLSSPRRGVSTP